MRKETDRILGMMRERNHVIFQRDDKPFNINYIEERTNPYLNNKIQDVLHLIWKFNGFYEHVTFPCTTKAGTYGITHNVKWGVMAAGQYLGVMKLGIHNRKYEAFCQRHGQVKAYRYDKASRPWHIENDALWIESGMFGRNTHSTSEKYVNHLSLSIDVDNWSLMCCVIPVWSQFLLFRHIIKLAKMNWGNKFTNTLINSYAS